MQSTETSNDHFRFLDLPRELRDRVYFHLLENEDVPPRSPEAAGDRYEGIDKSPENRGNLLYYERDLQMYYDRKPLSFACTDILYCSRQISTEMREYLMRRNQTDGTAGINYKIDCMVYDSKVWPTWTLLSAPPMYMQNLDVDIRVFGRGGSAFAGDGGYTAVTFGLLRLLGQFFQYGPDFVDRGHLKHPMRVNVFTINFLKVSQEIRDGIAYQTNHYERMRLGDGRILVCKLKNSGLLFGRVKRIRACFADKALEFEIKEKEYVDASAALWAQYGWIPGQQLSR